MAWSAEFREKMDVGGSPMFALDFQSAAGPGGFAGYSPELYVLHSHGVSDADNHISHALESFSGGGQSVSVRSWSSRAGAIRVKLSSASVASLIARKVPRGLPCHLMMGFAGWEYSRWQSLGIYQYENLSGKRNDWKITLGDGMKYLQSARPAGGGSSSVFGAAYTLIRTAWSPAVTPTALPCITDVGFKKDAYGRGLLKVEMDKTITDDPFFLKYTSISGSPPAVTFNVVDDDVLGTTRPVLVDVAVRVTHYNYIFQDLPTLVERFMLDDADPSTKGTMPDGYNVGLSYSNDFAYTDWQMWRDRWNEYEDFHVDMYTADEILNPIRYISDLMAKFGAWLVFKEGKLSFRFAQNILESSSTKPIFVDYEITDQDIVSIEKYQAFNSDTKSQSTAVFWHITPPPSSAYFDAVTLPAFADTRQRADGLFFDDDVETTNVAGAITHLRDRLDPWYTRVPDELTLNLRGWRWAEMVPGDCVEVSSDYVLDIMGDKVGPHPPTFNGDVFMLTAVHPNWHDFTTTVELTRLPSRHNPYI
jgi:hypothetical protein